MNLKNILIVGLGSIGLKHLRIAREIFPESRIAVLRHKETDEIPEGADEVFFKLSHAIQFQPQIAIICSPASTHVEISRALVMKPSILLVDEPSIGLEPRYIDMVFEILRDLQKNEKKTIILVEQNAKKGLEFADIGYVLVSGQTAIAGKGDDLLKNPDVGRLFLGG